MVCDGIGNTDPTDASYSHNDKDTNDGSVNYNMHLGTDSGTVPNANVSSPKVNIHMDFGSTNVLKPPIITEWTE